MLYALLNFLKNHLQHKSTSIVLPQESWRYHDSSLFCASSFNMSINIKGFTADRDPDSAHCWSLKARLPLIYIKRIGMTESIQERNDIRL
jgi:hypothetical protein